MSETIGMANTQWANRPDDERFWTVGEMRAACKAYQEGSRTAGVGVSDLRFEAVQDELRMVGKTGTPAFPTHYAFGQVAGLVKAPASYLRSLPPTLAAQNLNYGLAKRSKENGTDDKLSLLFHQNGRLTLRAANTDSYDRVWNWEVLDRCTSSLIDQGWTVPPAWKSAKSSRTRPATEADCGPYTLVKPGDEICPSGLYASDHDMFAYFIEREPVTKDGKLFRGVIVRNSEVGDCALSLMFFLHQYTCGNHNIWGAQDVSKVSVRHVKSENLSRGNTLSNAFQKWNVEVLPDARRINDGVSAARAKILGATKDEVLDSLFAFARRKSLNRLTKKTLEASNEIAETEVYGNPRSLWAQVSGLTQLSQESNFQDDRTELDVQAGRLLQMAF